jgi:small subunit ribosomal protein S16
VAVKIRLMRVGKKKQPTYRVVVADSRSPRDGRFIEILGQYAPRQDPSAVQVDSDRAVHWLREGAQPTEQVAKILEVAGVWDAYKSATGKDAVAKPKPRTPKPKQPKPAAEPAATAPAATAPAATAPAAADTADATAAGAGESGSDAAEATESE